ncbi:unnamed protein product [Cyprideis torosa]|uniref:Uncharacterized protein n=1 Tax=Cyprideis torosa TaxID=163714 RepID=A0A7R8W8L5_9CRUS|nr:unnamed protein product [Cyprideis torosa]CAG0884440.1 unnamed protein product [Cyprideis torosa]
MYSVHSSGKVFPYLLEGLRSTNGRQRLGCLLEMDHLIQHFGMSVFLNQIGPAMKEMARQISDRDSSVRDAALNAITQVYFIKGENVHRMIGQIPEKDLSLLKERIKRASKSRPPPPPVAQSTTTNPHRITMGASGSKEGGAPKRKRTDSPPEQALGARRAKKLKLIIELLEDMIKEENEGMDMSKMPVVASE